MADALAKLETLFARYGERWTPVPPVQPDAAPEEEAPISQCAFWRAMQRMLRMGDSLLADQGTAAFGAAALRLPNGAQLLVQPLWGLYSTRSLRRADRGARAAGDSDYQRRLGAAHHSGAGLDAAGWAEAANLFVVEQ
nr:indolepyruvate decarboxylase [Candidatus Pantoea persica]